MKPVTQKDLDDEKNKPPFTWSGFFDVFIPSFISAIIILVIMYFGGLIGLLSALVLIIVYHIYHRIKHGYWLDE